ncbi:hypothetical protein BSM4216_0912 [Bacillus smithii]|jgi:hypothetical protein|nr:hypothetical protein BSM4216_0912 [Bacillus smithii]
MKASNGSFLKIAASGLGSTKEMPDTLNFHLRRNEIKS